MRSNDTAEMKMSITSCEWLRFRENIGPFFSPGRRAEPSAQRYPTTSWQTFWPFANTAVCITSPSHSQQPWMTSTIRTMGNLKQGYHPFSVRIFFSLSFRRCSFGRIILVRRRRRRALMNPNQNIILLVKMFSSFFVEWAPLKQPLRIVK